MRTSGAVYGSLFEGGQPRRGDLWGAALDRLARHVTLEEDTSSIVGNAEHVATEDAQDAHRVLKEDGPFERTPGNEMVRYTDIVFAWY